MGASGPRNPCTLPQADANARGCRRAGTRAPQPGRGSLARARAWFEELVASRDFSLVFQPIFELASGSPLAVEAFVRFSAWSSRPPDAVIAQAHRVDLGVELEVAIVEAATAHLGELPMGAPLALNAGARALASGAVACALAATDASRIIIELTEQVSLDRHPDLPAMLAPMRRRGVRLAVDDDGTGMGPTVDTLALAPDFIKLDRVLAYAADAAQRREMVAALAQAASAGGAVLIAERVEAASELRALAELGIGFAQGFYLAHPGPVGELDALVEKAQARLRSLPD